ncbi:hypothetical protein Y032_0028g1649 [Ancylostoma ceylanicum]|uniref:Uncharacterized protein n=1 Tax=Ancylostoma ceylanicum TaxID=53326 RepID=A0A016UTD7_9BILA|nr:hypothetical protein Y032_0028g1649 [Ancylostoma ceylanicum]
MVELQVVKAKINNACSFIKSIKAEVKRLEDPFTPPQQRSECEEYVRRKTGELTHFLTTVLNAIKLHDTQISAAINHIAGGEDQKERERLMAELNKHLELESHPLEVTAAQWQNKIQFRQHEQREQSRDLRSTAPSISSNDFEGTTSSRIEKSINIRRPVLKICTIILCQPQRIQWFWAVFESLIHNDDELSDIDKFLFLKQALKGRAAVAISSILVVAARYRTAVNILKKQFGELGGYHNK